MSTLIMAAGCNPELSALHPAGDAARRIALLWQILLTGAGLIFALVMALLLLSFRRRPTAEITPASDRIWFWALGLAFPAVTLGALTVYGLILGERLRPRDAPDLVTVTAEARQWEWSFGYNDVPGRVTENILHIPADRPVDIEITSRDVIHSFWVPRLAGKLDAIPGHINVLRLHADAPGDYAGVSAEFSGNGYLGHVFSVRAHDPASWDRFLAGDVP